MRASKKRLTILRNKIQDTFPDGENIFDFDGISKQMILDVIDELYEIISLLDDHETKFEAILFERKTAEYYERASNLLKENLKSDKEGFNTF